MAKNFSKKISGIISKVFFSVFFIYREILSNNLFNGNGLIMWGLLIASLLFNFFAVGFKWDGNSDYLWFWLFIIYTIVSGMYVAKNTGLVSTWGTSFIISLIAFYLVLSYSKSDGHIDASINILIIVALAAIVVTRATGGMDLVRVSMSESANANSLGVMMMFAIAAVIYKINNAKKRLIEITPLVVLTLVFVYYMISTVSKKAILGTVILLLLWMFFCLPKQFSGSILTKWLLSVSIVILVLLGFYIIFKNKEIERYKYIYDRISGIQSDESTKERMALIREAWKIFLDHPVVGVGLNNCRYYIDIRETYSHSNYLELLSCTGLIGTFLFFKPVFSIIKNTVSKRNYHKKTRNNIFVQSEYMIIIMAVILFIYISQIAIYDFTHIYMLAIMCAYSQINNPKIKTRHIRIVIGR